MRKQAVLAVMLLVLVASVPAWARGGGGCLAKGTPIPTPAGAIAIENLRVGDPVWSVAEGELHAETVQALTETGTDRYLEILAGDSRIVITPEHPVMAGPGEYRIAGLLKAGDRVYRMRHGNLDAVPIRSIQPVREDRPAYNLMVMPGGTFIPAGIVVHNKGCFLPESLIAQPDGVEKPISAVRPGDGLNYYSSDTLYITVVAAPPALGVFQDTLTLVERGQTAAYVPFSICNQDPCSPPLTHYYTITSTGNIPYTIPGSSVDVAGAECEDVFAVLNAGAATACTYDELTIIVWVGDPAVYDTCVQRVHVVEPQPVPLFTVPVVTMLVLALILAAAVFMRRRAAARA